MDDQDHEGTQYGLVMPFVVCSSQGGTLDDDAFVAGYECGMFSSRLQRREDVRIIATVRTVNVPQLDLIAMQHGYKMETDDTEFDEWTGVTFERVDGDGQPS